MPQDIEGSFGQLVGKQLQIAQDKFARFVHVGRLLFVGQAGVEHVIIPVEHGFARILQALEEAGLYLVQHVEAHEDVAVVAQPVRIKLLYYMAVHHAFVCDAQFGEVLPVVPVDVSQLVPKGDELLFELRAFVDGEVLEKLLYGFFLLLVEEVVVVHDVLQILQVAEQLVGIYQVLVGIVEVADKQLAPEIEIIQRLFAVRFFAEHFVQFAHQPDRVAGFQRRKAAEQFADVDICGRPQRAVALSRQVFVEEQAGTFVGEYDCRARQVVPYLGV